MLVAVAGPVETAAMVVALFFACLQVTHTTIPARHAVTRAVDTQPILARWIAVTARAVLTGPAWLAVARSTDRAYAATRTIVRACNEGAVHATIAVIALA